MKVSNIKINGIKNPIGYSFDRVSLSYLITEAEGKKLVSTKIQISTTNDFKDIIYEKEDLSGEQSGIELDIEKKPRTRYYVRIWAVSDLGEVAVSTEKAYFETSKMNEVWTAKWITTDEKDEYHPVFCRKFNIDDSKKVERARLYISGLGLYHATINRKSITDEVLTPYYSNYHMETQYQTFDVTDVLSEKENEIDIQLGNGWYKGYFGLAHKKENFGSKFKLLAELRIIYADGTETVIGTDEDWQYKGSDTEVSDIYMGEWINHKLWTDKENSWKKAKTSSIEGRLVSRYSIATVEKENVQPVSIIHTPAGETVLDFGQNFAGYVEFNTKQLSDGTKVTLDFGEILQEGNFYNANYRDAKSQFIYVPRGLSE